MVFYSLFPGVLLLSRKSAQAAFLIAILALVFGAVFAFHLLDPLADWSSQWAFYVNPLNHLFLFVLGVVIAVRRLRLPLSKKWIVPAMIFCVLAFVMIPANEAQLFSGVGRICYSSLVILICWIMLDWKKGVGRFAPLLSWIGWISYGVYLLHPIFIRASILFVAYQLRRNPALISLCVGIPGTLIGATVSWVFFEKPMMQLGRRLLKANV
jgi:exopolysaccharide production protein ExoZ